MLTLGTKLSEFYILEIDISADNFMDVLDSGTYLCDLAEVIHKKAEECVKEGKCNDVSYTIYSRVKCAKVSYLLLN